MTGSFTPGPWSVPHFAKPDVNCECGYVLCDHLMGAVATVHCSGDGEDWKSHGDNPKFEEACANARLIAAAPEMYEACASVWSALADTDDARLLQLANECRAALAKASGEVVSSDGNAARELGR